MSFKSVYSDAHKYEKPFIQSCLNVDEKRVEEAIFKTKINIEDFAALLSPVARETMLEKMAQRANIITNERFGKTVKLYVPLYLSNYCTNGCLYCSFSQGNKIARKFLKREEVIQEISALADKGFKSILLVSGEDPKNISVEYLSSIINQAKKIMPSVSIETAPLDVEGYKKLVDSGLDGVTIYQETYDKEVYSQVHRGTKADFEKRLKFPENASNGGVRRVGVGALLGLSDFLVESYYLYHHINYLYKKNWQSQLALSFPRIRPVVNGYSPKKPLTDRELVQMVLAFRIAFNQLDLVLSTRESATFRDSMLGLGITQMSAGSRTDVGGYAESESGESGSQFEISDCRSVGEVVSAIRQKGYDAVWKDWEDVMYGVKVKL